MSKDYYYLWNQDYLDFSISEKWLEKHSEKYFCPSCFSRVSPEDRKINIQITKTKIPKSNMLGSFGFWDIGFIHDNLIKPLFKWDSKKFKLGNIKSVKGEVINGWHTFVSKGNRVPIRGVRKLTNDVCTECGKIRFSSPSKGGYIVAKAPLTDPFYENNEGQLLLREDVFLDVKPILSKKVNFYKVKLTDTPRDMRDEVQLEWHG